MSVSITLAVLSLSYFLALKWREVQAGINYHNPFFCYAYVLVLCILNTEIMSSPFGDKRSYVLNLLMWLGIYLGISLTISLLFDFPLSLILFLLAFVLIQIVRGYIRQRKEGGIKFRNFFSPQSSSMYGFKPVNYYCMSCGTKHNDRECPNCGSRMKRIGWAKSVLLCCVNFFNTILCL